MKKAFRASGSLRNSPNAGPVVTPIRLVVRATTRSPTAMVLSKRRGPQDLWRELTTSWYCRRLGVGIGPGEDRDSFRRMSPTLGLRLPLAEQAFRILNVSSAT